MFDNLTLRCQREQEKRNQQVRMNFSFETLQKLYIGLNTKELSFNCRSLPDEQRITSKERTNVKNEDKDEIKNKSIDFIRVNVYIFLQ